jgi:hypothetical protein
VGGGEVPLYDLGYTDSETVRVGRGELVHVRLGTAKGAIPGKCETEAGRQMILTRHSTNCGVSWKDHQFFPFDRETPG